MQSPESPIFEKKFSLLQNLSGLTLRKIPENEYRDYLAKKSRVYLHAVLNVKKHDPLAVEPWEIEETFPKAVLAYFQSTDDSYAFDGPEGKKERSEFLSEFNLKPDLFSINKDTNEIWLHEIEDQSLLTDYKLSKIHLAFQSCDEEGVKLRLFVYDRYGFNEREIDLWSFSLIPFNSEIFSAWGY
jgi:hypothetical protein